MSHSAAIHRLNSGPYETGREAALASWPHTAGMLVARTLLFLGIQGVIALIIAGRGQPGAFARSAAWWPVSAALASLITLGLLAGLLRRERLSVWQFLQLDLRHVKVDALTCLGVLVVSMPLVMFPNYFVARWLFGSETATGPLFFQPLPYAIALASSILFPLMVGLSELPTYFGYAMPRLEQLLGSRWGAVLISGFWLAAQHVTLPLILDWRFMLWRLCMFLPFALWMAMCLRWRPRLLPYLMTGHFLLDLGTAPMILAVAIR